MIVTTASDAVSAQAALEMDEKSLTVAAEFAVRASVVRGSDENAAAPVA